MHQTATSTTTMAYPSLPASPTLTNPDMILPYGDYDSTPSPPRRGVPPSPPGTWKGSKPSDMEFSIGPPRHLGIGLGPVTPTTPIIYGNGTMLSDIGEVTEAESTPGKSSKQTHTRISRGLDSPLRSSPTIAYTAYSRRPKTNGHKRTLSGDSTSTITSDSHAEDVLGVFDDFDDGISLDDSNFQGDDEESVADDAFDRHIHVAQVTVLTRKESKIINDDEDTQSSAALSRRAEMILANAKKRLDNMEGNLSRARSSLYITPSSSMSSIHSSSPLSRSTPSPQSDQRIIPALGVPPSKHRQLNNISKGANSSPGHVRVSSENSIPTNVHPEPHVPRSASAAGRVIGTGHTTTSSGGIESDGEHGRTTFLSSLARSQTSFAGHLEPLSEDESVLDETGYRGIRPSTTEPFLREIPTEHRPLPRATSAMQMRDLSDKMKDLKGKISTLRDRAREDTMKRRSLQSLRTPSPFTAAEQWYTGAKEYKGSNLSSGGMIRSPWNGEVSEASESVVEQEEKSDTLTPMPEENTDATIEHHQPVQDNAISENTKDESQALEPQVAISDHDDIYLTAEENGEVEGDVEEEEENEIEDEGVEFGEEEYDEEFVDHDELDEFQSEGEVSQYHDSLVTPISHEDREDAFDYEHFFLHSAMGTLSRESRGRRDSTGSFSSEDSVETTRGPTISTQSDDRSARGHLRNKGSQDSLSSMGTYATANENSYPEEDHDIYAVKSISDPPLSRPVTELTTKRSTFGSLVQSTDGSNKDPISSSTNPDDRPISTVPEELPQFTSNLHRPSVASFASNGTARSFPLVNKPKTLSSATASILSGDSIIGGESPVGMLAREDQILVERLVASLGKCVLGLHEAGRSSNDGKVWKRRLDAARRVLEGDEGAV